MLPTANKSLAQGDGSQRLADVTLSLIKIPIYIGRDYIFR